MVIDDGGGRRMMREREVEEIPREQCDDCIGGKSLLSSSSSFFRASRNSEITPPFLESHRSFHAVEYYLRNLVLKIAC